MEYIGDYNGREVFVDASYLIEGITAALDFLGDRDLVLLLDNFDTSTKRDKILQQSVTRRKLEDSWASMPMS